MQFGLTETQQILKNSAREFFAAECPIAEVRRLMETPTAYDAVLWQKMAHQGWTGIIFVSMARRPLTGRAVEEHLNGQSNLEAESPSL